MVSRGLDSPVRLLQQQSIKPLIARRFPLADARQAQELSGKGGVIGKIALVCSGSSLERSGGPKGLTLTAEPPSKK